MRNPLIIATRGSDLALWQANHIKQLLEEKGLTAALSIVKTKGDEIQHISLEKIEGKGFFTKEIEDALLNNEADIAVHSHKDLPTESPEELIIAAVTEREDPSEILLIRHEAVDTRQKFSLRKNALVGTSSSRRKSQLLAFRSDVVLKDLRGNVPTRVKKLRDGLYDAILVASAGIERLDLDVSDLHAEKLDPKVFIPAPAQGVLAVQVRKKDKDLIEQLQSIHNRQTSQTIAIERRVLNLFHGGCHAPVGAYAEYDEDNGLYKVVACKADSWNDIPVSVYAESKNPENIAERIVRSITSVKPCNVFITRNAKPDDYFRRILIAKNFKVTSRSLIEMIPVEYKSIPETEWIFFSSKHAVNFFFAQKPKLGLQKFGCIGKSTAEILRSHGKRADFIGSSTDTKLIGKQFASLAGKCSVLFPQAKGSLRSVQHGFVKKEQVIDLVVYETLKAGAGWQQEIDDSQVVLFTSPSNVEAFMEKCAVNPDQKIIAMGEATGNALKKSGVRNFRLPDGFDDAALVRAVFNRSSED